MVLESKDPGCHCPKLDRPSCGAFTLLLILYRLIKCLSFCLQVEGTFLRLAQGVSGVQQEHVVIEVNSLK